VLLSIGTMAINGAAAPTKPAPSAETTGTMVTVPKNPVISDRKEPEDCEEVAESVAKLNNARPISSASPPLAACGRAGCKSRSYYATIVNWSPFLTGITSLQIVIPLKASHVPASFPPVAYCASDWQAVLLLTLTSRAVPPSCKCPPCRR
jgi:hypothetical protein